MEDEDPRVFLTALRNVAEARGMVRIAQAAGVRRESPLSHALAHG